MLSKGQHHFVNGVHALNLWHGAHGLQLLLGLAPGLRPSHRVAGCAPHTLPPVARPRP